MRILIFAFFTMGLPNTFLATKKQYSDFELEAEFKVNEGMNTGIQYRIHRPPALRHKSRGPGRIENTVEVGKH